MGANNDGKNVLYIRAIPYRTRVIITIIVSRLYCWTQTLVCAWADRFRGEHSEHRRYPRRYAAENEEPATAVTRRREIYNANFPKPRGWLYTPAAAVNEHSQKQHFVPHACQAGELTPPPWHHIRPTRGREVNNEIAIRRRSDGNTRR